MMRGNNNANLVQPTELKLYQVENNLGYQKLQNDIKCEYEMIKLCQCN